MIDGAWIGPTSGYFSSELCPTIKVQTKSFEFWKLEECKNECEVTENCNAIRIHETSAASCYLQECPTPIPQPDDFTFSPQWVAYYQNGKHNNEN